MQLILNENMKMSSREIAFLTDKEHFHVRRDIEKMFVDLKEPLDGYIQKWIHPQNGQEYEEYLLDKDHVECLLTGYSAELRMRVIKRWHELEAINNKPTIPQTLPEALRLAADLAEVNQKQQLVIEQQKPAVDFVERYVKSEGNMTFRQVAKALQANERAFRRFLLDKGVIYYLNGEMTPKQPHQNLGRFVVNPGVNDSNNHAFTQMKFTPKGFQWISELWNNKKRAA